MIWLSMSTSKILSADLKFTSAKKAKPAADAPADAPAGGAPAGNATAGNATAPAGDAPADDSAAPVVPAVVDDAQTEAIALAMEQSLIYKTFKHINWGL